MWPKKKKKNHHGTCLSSNLQKVPFMLVLSFSMIAIIPLTETSVVMRAFSPPMSVLTQPGWRRRLTMSSLISSTLCVFVNEFSAVWWTRERERERERERKRAEGREKGREALLECVEKNVAWYQELPAWSRFEVRVCTVQVLCISSFCIIFFLFPESTQDWGHVDRPFA